MTVSTIQSKTQFKTISKIAIIVGSTRAARFADKPAQWIFDLASQRDDIAVELVDLRDFPMPFFEEERSPAWAPSANEAAQRWQQKLAEFDGYIFITAEYNHSITAVLKNALDYAYAEWARKPAAFVGYGGVGGARAIEQLRLICVEVQMAPVKTAVHIQMSDFLAVMLEGKPLVEIPHLQASATAMLDDLTWWSNALKVAKA